MSEIMVISDKNSVDVFNILGIKTIKLDKDKKINDNFAEEELKMAKIIFYDIAIEDYMKDLFLTVKKAVFIPLPLVENDMGKSLDNVRENIKKSIGIDLLQEV